MAEHFSIRTPALSLGKPRDVDEKKTGQNLWFWPVGFSVELPGIEPAALPGFFRPELQFRYVPFRFSPARYLRFCPRVLTASRAVSAGQIRPTTRKPQRHWTTGFSVPRQIDDV